MERSNFRSIQSTLTNPNNLMGFDNQGGIANGGVCWWHSRFQRNSHYLALFQPDQKKEEPRFYKRLIRLMVKGKKVVKIPGYKNLKEFSKTYRKYIQRQLNKWQLKDGFLKFAWVNGLQGRSSTTPEKLENMMDKLYQIVEGQKNLTYTKLQLQGIVAHAWLVYRMKKMPNGYEIFFIDSNWASQPKKYYYQYDDKTLDVYGGGLLYPEKGREFDKLKGIVTEYCSTAL